MSTTDVARLCRTRADAFSTEAHRLFSRHEKSKSRVFSLPSTKKTIRLLTLQQEHLFEEAVVCIENDAHRAAIVLAWAGYMDYLEERLARDGLKKVHALYPNWSKYRTIEELRENVVEHQLVEAAYKVGLLGKTEHKTMLGFLSKRNECAHPSSHIPDVNESLGFLSDLLQRVDGLSRKPLL